jgi:OOP family OmpA-OmpF porin
MWSSDARAHARKSAWRALWGCVTIAALLAVACPARAQQAAAGFDVDRLYLSAPGAGWLIMDTLDTRGGLGGIMGATISYARDPLRIRTPGGPSLAVVSDDALVDLGFAATYGRFRAYLNFDIPLDVSGRSGTAMGYQFTSPTTGQGFTPSGVNPSTAPDVFEDARVGIDARILGAPKGPFRLGLSAQLYIPGPNSNQSEYVTDGAFHGMARVQFAGDVGRFTYAGQVGVHIRPLDESPVPESPEGSELVFGVAAGPRFLLGKTGARALIVGPEIYGETAFRRFFGTDTTGVEGLLTGRLEGTADDGAQFRFKLGVGGGLDPHFGAPEFRAIFAIELFDRHTDRDGDGISDSKDACPDVPGVKTGDPKTNGCPGTTPTAPWGEIPIPPASGAE